MKFVKNRSAILVTPKHSFLEWMRQVLSANEWSPSPRDSDEADSSGTRLYLVEEVVTTDQATLDWLVESHWDRIFEFELSLCTDDESAWPELTLETFREWFDVQLYPTIVDLPFGWIRRSRM